MQKKLAAKPLCRHSARFCRSPAGVKTRPPEKTYNLLSVCDALKSAIP